MNSPEEKAVEIIVKIEGIGMTINNNGSYDYYPTLPNEVAKAAALICVDEIIPCTWKKSTYEKQGYYWTDERTTTEYWQKVKEEIQKL